MLYFEEAKRIWKTHVPKSGQSLTVEGEMLRAIECLRWEAQNNGNINWDSGFVRFCELLKNNLLNENIFARESIKLINDDINRILVSGDYLKTCSEEDEMNFDMMPYIKDDLYDRLSDSVVLWSRYHGGPVQRKIDEKQHR